MDGRFEGKVALIVGARQIIVGRAPERQVARISTISASPKPL